MPVSIVDPSSTLLRHLASVDVKFSGIHIGGGIYFSANHYPSPGGTSKAIPQRWLDGEAEEHRTTEYDYTLPGGDEPWNDYRDDLNGDGTPDAVKAGFDMSMHVGDRLLDGEFYSGPAAPMLIAMDGSDLSGTAYITGYPGGANSLNGEEGVLHETSGTVDSYTVQNVNGDEGGYFQIEGAQVLGGMSGGGTFLDFDADGDGSAETYVIGTLSRGGIRDFPDPLPDEYFAQVAAFAPHYAELAAALQGLTGGDARTADDFARMTLLSAQSLGSSATFVQGQFFHENLFGGVNADTLLGAGGDDLLDGRDADDSLDGGDGLDTLIAGAGNDTLTGGGGRDWFMAASFGEGATDEITDFEDSTDILDLSLFFSSFAQVLGATTDNPDGSITIDLGSGTEPAAAAGGTLIMANMTSAQLTGSNTMVACFTTGTRIATARGMQLIETLRLGDRIWTRDHGMQRLRAVASTLLGPDDLAKAPNLRPIRIRRGALGNGVPSRDLVVSPQHRILVDGALVDRMLGTSEALIPARKLLPLQGVHRVTEESPVCYVHLVLARHEILLAEGCLSESFYPGDTVLKASPKAHKDLLRHVTSALPARILLRKGRAERLVMRHRRNRKPLQSIENGAQPFGHAP